MEILSPIPPHHLPDAARMWWAAFGPIGARPQMRAEQGAAAVRGGDVVGVMGLRDGGGGFLATTPLMARLLFRAAPPTDDLVIDGIAVSQPRQGTGAALLDHALDRARAQGRNGLRAEVRARNHAARAFWQAMGFVEIARGRYGWPWSGQVLSLRRPLSGTALAERPRDAAQQGKGAG